MADRESNPVLAKTFELLDCVEAQLFWIIAFAKEHNAPEERLESLNHLVTRTRVILQELHQLQKGEFLLGILVISLVVPHVVTNPSTYASSPTESLQHNVPTVKATLPDVR